VSFTVKGDPRGIVSRWRKAIHVTAADAVSALNLQKTRILQRTARGVDVEGRAFRPYSTKGPYTYYPNARAGGSSFTERQSKAAAARLKRKLAAKPTKGAGGMRLTRSGKGIVFDSYAAFKRWLGRTTVDLRGPRAPHMLQALVVKVVGSGDTVARDGRLGIYGAEATRASGHTYGAGRLPKRKFLGVSIADRVEIVKDIKARITARLGRK